MKKNANPIQDKETNELFYRLYEDCMKFKKEKGIQINCNYYSAITNNTPAEKKKQDMHYLFLFDRT